MGWASITCPRAGSARMPPGLLCRSWPTTWAAGSADLPGSPGSPPRHSGSASFRSRAHHPFGPAFVSCSADRLAQARCFPSRPSAAEFLAAARARLTDRTSPTSPAAAPRARAFLDLGFDGLLLGTSGPLTANSRYTVRRWTPGGCRRPHYDGGRYRERSSMRQGVDSGFDRSR